MEDKFIVQGSDKVNRSIRIDKDFADQLHKIAQDNNISFSALVVQCCRFAIERMDIR